MNSEIYISYAWNDPSDPYEGSRKEMADRFCSAFEAKGHKVIRDINALGYKDNIPDFMRRIGNGMCVLAVVSDKYLRSRYCMTEALEMEKHPHFADRVFPLVMPDARRIYDENGLGEYGLFWKNRLDNIEAQLKQLGDGIDTTPLQAKRFQIRNITEGALRFITKLGDMNLLTPQMHLDRNFEDIIQAVENSIQRDRPAPPMVVSASVSFPPIENVDVSHALRPEFTKHVLKMLLQDLLSTNVHAPKGTGKARLLDDIVKYDIPGLTRVRVNMRNYVTRYQGLLKDIALQLGVSAGAGQRMADVFNAARAREPRPTLLLLDNFDAILDDPKDLDKAYDVEFLNHLNAQRNSLDTRVLLTTLKPHNQSRFRGRTSWLDVKPTPLPELSESQIKTEILRRFPGDALSAAVLTYLAEQVETDTQPHDLLRKVLDRIPERLEDLNRAKALVKEAKRAV